jgi:hypothetical protein
MPSLNDIMSRNTTLSIVEHSVSGIARVVIDGEYYPPPSDRSRSRLTFDFISNDFQIVPVRFFQNSLNGSEIQKRNASIVLFQNHTLLTSLIGPAPSSMALGGAATAGTPGINFNSGVEQDAIILDNGRLHDIRRGRDTSHSPDRTNQTTIAVPSGRQFVAYFHTHPYSLSMRPPTPSSDWNEVPGVGFPGRNSILHFMIEGNKRIWGLLDNRRAFIVGIIRGNAFLTLDAGSNAINHCWQLSG